MLLPLPENSRSALLIIDMQEFFFQKAERRRNLAQVVGNINWLIEVFDGRKWPVYHVVSQYKADGSDWDLKMKAAGVPELIEGTPEADILPAIDVESRHKVVAKTRYSAFFNTSLAADLQAENVDRAVVVGAYTHYCVNATVFDAYGHNFVPCLLADAVLSHLPRETELLVERMRRNGYHVKPTEAFITSLDQD